VSVQVVPRVFKVQLVVTPLKFTVTVPTFKFKCYPNLKWL
jgi:hypothetical protein